MKRRWMVLAMAAGPGLGATPPMLEAELRWVEQAAPPTGSVASNRGAIEAAGPALRVAVGGRAEWELEGPQILYWAEARSSEGRGGLAQASAPRWRLAVAPSLQGAGKPLRVEIEWQRPEPGGGWQRWSSQLDAPLDRWVIVSRSAPRPAPKGSVSTTALQPLRELQLKLSWVNE